MSGKTRNTDHPLARLARRITGLHRAQDGQVIYVVILYFFLMAGLVFLVMNTGEKLYKRIEVQGAADSATATGAAWYARGLNVISMANVGETQLLSLIVLLDTLESVVPPSTECIDDLVENIGSSKAGRDIPIDSRVSDWLVVGNAASERVIIHQFDDIVRNIDWPRYLTYDTGVLWECTKLLDGFSHAMRDVTPLAAQREAMDIAKKNHAEFGFITPLWPELPVVNGQFLDFRNPMRTARMPAPNDRQIIGGFAWVMNYRGYHNQVLGPYSYWREPFVSTQPMGLFDISRFSTLFIIVSDRKFDMMFGGTDDEVSLRDWEMDYDKARGAPTAPPNRAPTGRELRRAWWESSSFDARYEFPKPEFFSNINLRNPQKPIPWVRTYRTMDQPNLSRYTRAKEAWEGADPREAVWYRAEERKTAHYPQLGIYAPHPPNYPDGSPWQYTDAEMQIYYRVSLWRFNGAEFETDENLHRRYLPPAGGAPLAPIMFDPQTGENSLANISERFTINGFAYREGRVRDWPTRFRNPNPIPEMIGYAQARVYSRYSHDLFTQHWKVKLMRTDRWNELASEIGRGVPSQAGELAGELTAERLEPVLKMLQSYDERFVLEWETQGVTH